MVKRASQIPPTQAVLRHWREAVPNDRLAHLIKDAARGATRALQVRLAEHHVAFGHWVFLRILWVKDGLTQRELSEEAGLMEPTTFSALVAMEKLGYIERRRLPHSRKNMYVFLTPSGRALREKLVPLAQEVNHIMVAGLETAEVATARRVLLAMIENLAADDAARAGVKGEAKADSKADSKSDSKTSAETDAATPALATEN